MAKHTGGAKMSKVEKKVEKNMPEGIKHHGHTGGVKMEKVEKKVDKAVRKKNKSIKNLWGLLSVVMAFLLMVVCLAACGEDADAKTYTTAQLAEIFETSENKAKALKGTTCYIQGQLYEYDGDEFSLIPVDADGDGYGTIFTCSDYGRKVKKAVKSHDTTDTITVYGEITKVSKKGFEIKVKSVEFAD